MNQPELVRDTLARHEKALTDLDARAAALEAAVARFHESVQAAARGVEAAMAGHGRAVQAMLAQSKADLEALAEVTRAAVLPARAARLGSIPAKVG